MSKTELRKTTSAPIAYEPPSALPANDIGAMSERFRRAVAETFGMPWITTTLGWSPAVEVTEGEKEVTVTVELPGLSKDDIRVRFTDGMLTIQGEKREERREEEPKRQYHLVERSYGSFLRTFALPRDVNEKDIAASFRDGVLKVTLPLAPGGRPRGTSIPISE
jgi:HSP20 family protein